MKPIRLVTVIATGLLASTTTALDGQERLEEVWAAEGLETPESVLYDASRGVLYVSNIAGSPREKDGNGFISVLSLSGEITDLRWVTGLNAPKGLGVREDRLYVTDIDELIEIDIEAGSIVNRYPGEEAQFLNDVTVDARGDVYVSDSTVGRIYRLRDGMFESWLENESTIGVNGLFAEADVIMAGSFQVGTFMRVEIESGQVVPLQDGFPSFDGVVPDGNGNYWISGWQGQVYLTDGTRNNTKLLDTQEQGINAADIEYVASQGLLLVPTFNDNRVVAYRLR